MDEPKVPRIGSRNTYVDYIGGGERLSGVTERIWTVSFPRDVAQDKSAWSQDAAGWVDALDYVQPQGSQFSPIGWEKHYLYSLAAHGMFGPIYGWGQVWVFVWECSVCGSRRVFNPTEHKKHHCYRNQVLSSGG